MCLSCFEIVYFEEGDFMCGTWNHHQDYANPDVTARWGYSDGTGGACHDCRCVYIEDFRAQNPDKDLFITQTLKRDKDTLDLFQQKSKAKKEKRKEMFESGKGAAQSEKWPLTQHTFGIAFQLVGSVAAVCECPMASK